MKFTVFIPPTGKARPRVTRRRTYTPKKTKQAENEVKAAFEETCEGAFDPGVPLRMSVTAWFPIPKSYTRKHREACLIGLEQPTKKPDCDNIYKLIADALNCVAYADDQMIVQSVCTKKYYRYPNGYNLDYKGHIDIEIGVMDSD